MDTSLVPALEDVLTVARTGSVGQAARKLHKTPSAVSQQIRRVEEQCGVALFERAGRGVRLSPSGEAALSAIGRLFDEAKSVFELLSSLAGKPTTTVRVATSDYLGKALLVPVLRELLAEGAPLRFEITSANSFDSVRLVEDGEVDFAIVTRAARALAKQDRRSRRAVRARTGGEPPLRGATGSALEERALFRQPFVWVGPKSQAPARALHARLDTEPLLRLSPGSQGRRLLDAFIDQERLHPTSTIDLSGVGLLVSYVLGGVGIGLAPALALADVPKGRIAIERADVPPLPVVLVYRERTHHAAAARGIERFVERVIAQGIRAERRMEQAFPGSGAPSSPHAPRRQR